MRFEKKHTFKKTSRRKKKFTEWSGQNEIETSRLKLAEKFKIDRQSKMKFVLGFFLYFFLNDMRYTCHPR